MTETKIFVADDVSDSGLQPLRAAGFNVDKRPGLSASELRAAIADCAGLVSSDPFASRVVIALRESGKLAEASAQADAGLEVFPGFTDLVFHQANIAKESGDVEESRRLYERCLEMGDAPARYTATVGCGSYLALMALAALSLTGCGAIHSTNAGCSGLRRGLATPLSRFFSPM